MHELVKEFEEINQDNQNYAGGKGASLARLFKAGFPVPRGFVLFPQAFKEERLNPFAWKQVLEILKTYRDQNEQAAFAVRSSALSEDSSAASFAGEFETVLNVKADEEIYKAIQTVFESRKNERVQAYSQARGFEEDHQIAVVIQELVPAEASGVLFTANPVNAKRDEIMITAAWGLGEAVVGGMVSTDTILANADGEVLSYQIASKEIMTQLKQGGTQEEPVPQNLREKAVLKSSHISELVSLGKSIEKLYETPMDIEWTLLAEQINIVQARPITTLERGDKAEFVEWKLPVRGRAVRNNIVEMMADPLTPLFRSIGLPAVNVSMHRRLTQFLGNPDLMDPEMIVTVNQYAYYNSSLSTRQYLGIILASGSIMKRMMSGAVERWLEGGKPQYQQIVQHWKDQEWQQLTISELLRTVSQLAEAAVDAYGSMVSGLIPAAWMSEAWFTYVNKFLKGRLDPQAAHYLLGFDSIPMQAEKSLFDLAQWGQGNIEMRDYLLEESTRGIIQAFVNQDKPDNLADNLWKQWLERFCSYLDDFGHMIYNLDFSNPVPADDPGVLIETIKSFIEGQACNPYKRQAEAVQSRQKSEDEMFRKLKGLRLKVFKKALKRAQRYAPLREDSLTDLGLAYPLIRQMLAEVGQRLKSYGCLPAIEHVYWLTEDEIEAALESHLIGECLGFAAIVKERKAAWIAARRLTPPLMLPQIRIFGRDIAELKSGRSGDQENSIKGVGASPGLVTGTARVLTGPQDFEQMKNGDILVAAITTPAWTPLFTRAAAIVTDVGGPLSHGSIVAREYGIPAVLGTKSATRRIRSGQIITVDGSLGMVYLPDLNEEKGDFNESPTYLMRIERVHAIDPLCETLFTANKFKDEKSFK
ncbi:MAG: hypothetical protein JEZ06_19835 [Anaerolineaceae bacterium]|nr:hypothetical protein [Anaerolineaceae bacterium]